MKSTILKLAVSALVLIGGLAAEGEALAQSFTPYTNPGGGFTIMYPGNWERRMVGTTMVALSPQESPADTFRENVNVVFETLPAPMTPQQYALLSRQTMQRQLNNFVMIEQGGAGVAGQPAHYMVYQHFMGQNLTVLAYFLVRGNRGYVITCSASPQTFARFRPFFVQIANTLSFH